jgi:thiol-disulfide isomerase/thioredoxin
MKYIKFEANWCGACKMIKPILRRVEEAGIPVEIVNAEFSAELVTQYNIKNLPTVILVDNSGKELHREVGSKMRAPQLIETYNNFANG